MQQNKKIVITGILMITGVIIYWFYFRNPFVNMKRIGAVKSVIFPDSVEYKGLRFFKNNRVADLTTKKMGSYDYTKIVWDDKTIVLLKDLK